MKTETPREWREYTSGAGASALAVVVTFPINKAMFRQQVHNIKIAEALKQLKNEGPINLYRGLISPLLMKVTCQSVMFGSYTQFSRVLTEYKVFRHNQMNKMMGAVMAGASEAILMPLERVQVLMQDQKYNLRYKNSAHAFYSLRVHGVTEYYRGFSAILLRNCPGNVIFFTCRERIKENLPESWKRGQYSSILSDFLSGACLGAFISSMFFPVNVTKTHMQLRVGGSFLKFRKVYKGLLEERGLKGMFRGVHVNYTRHFKYFKVLEPERISKQTAGLAHCSKYMDKFFNGLTTSDEQRRTGFKWTHGLVSRTRFETGGTVLAALVALQRGVACSTGGGTHHAGPDYGSGYCLINDLAVASRYVQHLINKNLKILIIDLDVHQGDGTALILQDDPHLFTFSMHCQKNFPFRKQKSNLDIGLEDHVDDKGYMSILQEHLPNLLDSFRPDLAIFDAGVDVHGEDDLGRLNLTDNGIFQRDEYVFKQLLGRGIPVCSVIGGGYHRDIKVISRRHSIVHRAASKVYENCFL